MKLTLKRPEGGGIYLFLLGMFTFPKIWNSLNHLYSAKNRLFDNKSRIIVKWEIYLVKAIILISKFRGFKKIRNTFIKLYSLVLISLQPDDTGLSKKNKISETTIWHLYCVVFLYSWLAVKYYEILTIYECVEK